MESNVNKTHQNLVKARRINRWSVYLVMLIMGVLITAYYQNAEIRANNDMRSQLSRDLISSLITNDSNLAAHIVRTYAEKNSLSHIRLYKADGTAFVEHINQGSDVFVLSRVGAGSVTSDQNVSRIEAGGVHIGTLEMAWGVNDSMPSYFNVVLFFLAVGLLMAAYDLVGKQKKINKTNKTSAGVDFGKTNPQHLVENAVKEMGVSVCFNHIYEAKSSDKIFQSYASISWVRQDGAVLNVSLAELSGLTERNSLTIPIVPWVIQAVLTQLKSWREIDPKRCVVFGVSQKQFMSIEYLNFIDQMCHAMNIDTDAISIEIDERVLSRFEQRDVDVAWNRWNDIGVSIVVSGYGASSKSREIIGRYNIKAIKWNIVWLQQQFESISSKERLIELVKMARGLGVVTIVEGVESAAGWRLFHDINANYFQDQKYSESIRPSNFGELASDIRIDNASIPVTT